MIALRNLTRRYGDTVAVQGVSAEIRRGEIVGLLGHNGAGKTTVMKILTGYLEPSEGSVTVDGLDVETHRAEVQGRIGYLPENAPLYDEMLVQEYLLLIARLRGVPAADVEARVADAVVATGLQDRLVAPIGTLSKGLRQRVGIAQAIVHRPDVLVLDEPTNGLDPMQIQAIRQLVLRLGASSTILLSTHILQEIEAVCERVLVMIDGQLAADARLDDLLDAHRVKLVLASGAADVPRVLGALPTVSEVVPLPAEGGHEAWAVRYVGETPPVPSIVAAAVDAGWTIASVGPDRRTLQAVFEELQQQHIARRGGEA